MGDQISFGGGSCVGVRIFPKKSRFSYGRLFTMCFLPRPILKHEKSSILCSVCCGRTMNLFFMLYLCARGCQRFGLASYLIFGYLWVSCKIVLMPLCWLPSGWIGWIFFLFGVVCRRFWQIGTNWFILPAPIDYKASVVDLKLLCL